MPGALYFNIRQGQGSTLRTASRALSKVLNIAPFIERESSNYVGDQYYTSTVLGIQLNLALADDSRFEQYQFWLALSPDAFELKGSFELLAALSDFVARNLCWMGFDVARDTSSGRIGDDRKTTYSREVDPQSGRMHVRAIEL